MHHVKWVSLIIPNILIATSGNSALAKVNSWFGRNSDPNRHVIITSSEIRGRVSRSNLGSMNLQEPRFVFINHLLIISSLTLAYGLNYDLRN